jgi:hypothetical protein
MIVYATQLFLEPKPDVLDKLREAIQKWLLRKIGPEFTGIRILPFGERRFQDLEGNSHKVKIIGTPTDKMPNYCNIRYSHADREVNGRAWITSIGFEQRHPNMPARCTVVLETSEISALAGSVPVSPSIPGIVKSITKMCPLHEKTLSSGILKVTHQNAEGFLDGLENENRNFPIVLISVDDYTREPLVDLDELREKLVGIAQIAFIPNSFEAKLVAGHIPARFTAWNGSINIIRPSYRGVPRASFYRREEIGSSEDFNKYIFETIVHHQNFPISREHISESSVREILTTYNIRRLREELQAKGDFSQFEELVSSYEEDVRQSKDQISQLQEEVFSKELYSEDLEHQIDKLRSKIRALQYQLSQAESVEIENAAEIIEEASPESFEELISSLEDKIDHAVVLTTKAERSLKKCIFNDVERVWKAIRILNEDLSRTFKEGYDVELVMDRLKNETNSTYVANTSETTLGKFGGYEAVHNGRTITGKRHLKVGCSRDPQRCFRLYFDWDDYSQKIIVTHAGAHLDNHLT